jgi:1-acyl-sn-glycerol-3-phosphate acyltransferase
MNLTHQIVNTMIKGVTHCICRVDDSQLAHVPSKGPLILVANHVNFLEIPIVYTHLMPRQVTGFAKAETWDNPALRPLFNLWNAIPLKRGEADVVAMRRAIQFLQSGGILAIAPEGTRSGNGQLKRGQPGVVTLALLSGVPILPMAYHGGERFHQNIRRFQRTEFNISIGRIFVLDTGGEKNSRDLRQQMTDEIMFQLAALLPPEYRGYYSNLQAASIKYLRFLPETTRS